MGQRFRYTYFFILLKLVLLSVLGLSWLISRSDLLVLRL